MTFEDSNLRQVSRFGGQFLTFVPALIGLQGNKTDPSISIVSVSIVSS